MVAIHTRRYLKRGNILTSYLTMLFTKMQKLVTNKNMAERRLVKSPECKETEKQLFFLN